jgi:hypothetical protein
MASRVGLVACEECDEGAVQAPEMFCVGTGIAQLPVARLGLEKDLTYSE